MKKIAFIKAILWTALGAFAFDSGEARAESEYKFKHGKVELLSNQEGIVPGRQALIGVKFSLDPGWHVYWKNPGDAGMPTKIDWILPEKIARIADTFWPEPKKYEEEELTTFGYDGAVLLVDRFAAARDLPAKDRLPISAKLSWMICNDECIPGEATLGLDLPVVPAIVKSAAAEEFERTLSVNGVQDAAGAGEFLCAVLFAFLGGLILNLMPCVFPVLSLKIFSFVRHGQEKARKHGMFFALGVLVSFWALAGLLLGLRAGGAQLGWGFQFQSPVFVSCMGLLVFTLALSMLGVVEFGSGLQRAAGKMDVHEGYSGSFFSGVLATALATPCTAPFMGSALAVALALPPLKALIIFSSLGLGLALPYVLLTFFPALLKLLPRPGEWMVVFKQLMAFPMLLTVLWLSWVLGAQVGLDGVISFMLGLITLSFGLWIMSRFDTPGASVRSRRLSRAAFSIAAILSAYLAIPVHSASAGMEAPKYGKGISWEPFSESKLNEALKSGRPVLLDFTAAWCLTCQVNHKVAFGDAEVQNLIKEKGVIALRGDWTNKDPQISKAIEKYGRSGVPLNVFYRSDSETPIILPSILTPRSLISKL